MSSSGVMSLFEFLPYTPGSKQKIPQLKTEEFRLYGAQKGIKKTEVARPKIAKAGLWNKELIDRGAPRDAFLSMRSLLCPFI